MEGDESMEAFHTAKIKHQLYVFWSPERDAEFQFALILLRRFESEKTIIPGANNLMCMLFVL